MEVRRVEEWKKPLPDPDATSEVWWRAAAEGRLLFQACPRCGHRQLYPRPLCLECGATPEWQEASGRGSVHTFTIVRQHGAPPFRDELPYVVAVVDLEEGVRVLSNLTDCEPESVHVGMAVEAHAALAAEGVGVPLFRPAAGR